MRARWIAVAAGAAVLAAGVVVVAWPDGEAHADPEVEISRSACGTGWTDPRPGPQVFQLHNTGSVTAEVDLVDPATGVIYGEVEGLSGGTTRPMQVTLANGDYAFRCLPEDTPAITGPKVTVTGGAARSPGVAPVTRNDLLGPLKIYEQRTQEGLNGLASQTAALKGAVHSGNRDAAKTAWLTAHLAYERLGAAYDAFGDFDGSINGTADGLPGGPGDEGFTGFHRLEAGLWHNEDMAALAPVADQLDTDAQKLRDSFADSQIDGNDLGLRAHEIMENTLQFELTGHTDYGSGSNLATTKANLDGTQAVLDVLRPLLTPRYPGLPTVDKWIARTRSDVDKAGATPLARLDPKTRQRLNADVSQLCELLAPIAAIAEPRRVS